MSSVLDPNRPPRADKASILGDATRVLMQLRAEAQELKESNEKLHEAIKDLKVWFTVMFLFFFIFFLPTNYYGF